MLASSSSLLFSYLSHVCHVFSIKYVFIFRLELKGNNAHIKIGSGMLNSCGIICNYRVCARILSFIVNDNRYRISKENNFANLIYDFSFRPISPWLSPRPITCKIKKEETIKNNNVERVSVL